MPVVAPPGGGSLIPGQFMALKHPAGMGPGARPGRTARRIFGSGNHHMWETRLDWTHALVEYLVSAHGRPGLRPRGMETFWNWEGPAVPGTGRQDNWPLQDVETAHLAFSKESARLNLSDLNTTF